MQISNEKSAKDGKHLKMRLKYVEYGSIIVVIYNLDIR